MRSLKRLTWGIALFGLIVVASAAAQAQSGRPGQGAPTPGASPQGAAADRELTVVNRSKHTVNELYVSPSSADQWGDDKLGDDTLDPGKSTRVRLGRTRDCEFDVQVVYDDASHEESRNFNICRNRQVAFDGSTAVAAPKAAAGDSHTLTIANHAGRPIQQIFISPADASQWGDDRLGDDSISVGDDKDIEYHGDCAADLRIVFDNRSAEERRGLDICDTPTVSIEPGWTTADTVPTGTAPAPAPAPAPAAPPIAQAPASPSTGRPIPPTTEKGGAQALATPSQPTPPRVPAPPTAVPQRPAPQAAPAPAPAAGTVTVTNQSGHSATELYIFPDGSSDRGQDRLGTGVLNSGQNMTVRLDRGGQCKFAAHVVYSGNTPDGDIKGIDLCAAPQIVLKP